MKKALALLAVVMTLGLSAVAFDAEAKRLGGAKSGGMQRQATTAPTTPPAGGATQAAPAAGTAAAAGGAAAAAAPKRSWMGPVAGLAAGLGLAALASHLGFGEAFANMMMIGLLVMAVLVVVGLVMRKRAMPNASLAGAGGPSPAAGSFGRMGSGPAGSGGLIGSGLAGAGAMAQAGTLPAGFDAAGFARNAKSQFLALQAANDARDLDQLREFLAPEMFDIVRDEIAARGDAQQQTEVFGLDAQVLGVVEEGNRYIASVRFTGSVRDQRGAVPDDLDETWHLAKPISGAGGWVIAGIQQNADGPLPN